MAIIAKETGGSNIPPLAEGIYTAVCCRLIDLGIQYNEKYDKDQRKIMIGWEVVGETIEVDGEEQPRILHKSYTTSLHEKSALRKDLQAWRGKAFTPEELAGFDLGNILGVPCQLQVIHEKKDDKTYTNIAAIMAVPRGLEVPKAGKLIYLDFEDRGTFSMIDLIPDFITRTIAKAKNFESSGLKAVAMREDDGDPFPEVDTAAAF